MVRSYGYREFCFTSEQSGHDACAQRSPAGASASVVSPPPFELTTRAVRWFQKLFLHYFDIVKSNIVSIRFETLLGYYFLLLLRPVSLFRAKSAVDFVLRCEVLAEYCQSHFPSPLVLSSSAWPDTSIEEHFTYDT